MKTHTPKKISMKTVTMRTFLIFTHKVACILSPHCFCKFTKFNLATVQAE